MILSRYGLPTAAIRETIIGRITRDPVSLVERPDCVLVASSLKPAEDFIGYAAVLIQSRVSPDVIDPRLRLVHGCGALDDLATGDVVALNPAGYVRTLYRRASRHNVLFATDHCNSYCLMCSQPPRNSIDESGIMAEHRRLINLIHPDTEELGITGGEPTLLGEGFLELISLCKERLPGTALHVLTNGRLFYYGHLARQLAEIKHHDLMLGIPVYSDQDAEHDYVVQARGAFEETIIGLHNLGRYGVRVEIRVVIHSLTYQRLPALAEFLYRNVPFAAQITLMGLEPIGFAVPNLKDLWVDPVDYQEPLRDATLFLARRGMRVSIYNHQLCVVPPELWQFCRRSISDWKNIYLPVCASCTVRDLCGGFFHSATKAHSAHIAPFTTLPDVERSI